MCAEQWLLGNRDKNFDEAMNTIVNRMKKIVDTPVAAEMQYTSKTMVLLRTVSGSHSAFSAPTDGWDD